MTFEQIVKAARQTVEKHKTRDPFEIARAMDIEILFVDDFVKLKGMYRVIRDHRFVFINSKLAKATQNIVCAHEIGHDLLHRHLAVDNSLQEFVLYQMDSRPEYEANVFAAELLLSDEDILDCIDKGYDVEMTAKRLNSDINLVALKVSHLIKKGYMLRSLDHRSDFLK